jgi:hypothetical protein
MKLIRTYSSELKVLGEGIALAHTPDVPGTKFGPETDYSDLIPLDFLNSSNQISG